MASNILVWLLSFTIVQVHVAASGISQPTLRLASLVQAPATTSKPKIPRGLLDRRDVQTCGYFDADPSQPYTCGIGQDCVSNTIWNIFGCCVTDLAGDPITSSCPSVADPFTSCVEYISASFCTGDCSSSNRLCSESTLPYCAVAYSYTGVETYTQWFCQDVAGGTPSLTLFAIPSTTISDTTSIRTTTSIVRTTSILTTSSIPSTTTSPTSRSDTTTPVSSPISSALTSPTPDPTVVHSESKTNSGAIAGGVVGGLAGLGLIIGGAIYFLHRAKKRERKNTFAEVSQI